MVLKNKKIHRNKSIHNKEDHSTSKNSVWYWNIPYFTVLFTLAIAVGVVHRYHVASLFENQRHFSHLSTLERELSFRTEMGLYYSYYKRLVNAPTFFEGVSQILNDNCTEYPDTINTLKRFNLYPEVTLAFMYRTFISIADNLNIETKQCWKVNRGNDMSPVESCEGLGDLACFYVESVFVLHGLLMSTYFLFGSYLSGGILGGVVTCACVFYNHGECTRVMWTPPLRESFAYPFFVVQMFLVTVLLRVGRSNVLLFGSLTITSICFILTWQFSQFTLLTQVIAVFSTYVLNYIDGTTALTYTATQTVSLVTSCLFLFGNKMLISSFYASAIVASMLLIISESWFKKLGKSFYMKFTQVAILLIGTFSLKAIISRLLSLSDDAHVLEILLSKFSSYKTFHTMLYTCAVEFDFLERTTFLKLSSTLLLPTAVVVILTVLYKLIKAYLLEHRKPPNKGNSSQSDRMVLSRDKATMAYHLLQLIAFTIMAVLIMRLKLFWTPHLCVVASLIASRTLFSWIKRKEIHYSLIACLLAIMSVSGFKNVSNQRSMIGEFNNYPMEQLIEWTNTQTMKGAVFAGPMPTMATIRLSTEACVVNHPHYEDASIRERTKKVYTIFSRKPLAQVHQILQNLQVAYIILEPIWCGGRSNF